MIRYVTAWLDVTWYDKIHTQICDVVWYYDAMWYVMFSDQRPPWQLSRGVGHHESCFRRRSNEPRKSKRTWRKAHRKVPAPIPARRIRRRAALGAPVRRLARARKGWNERVPGQSHRPSPNLAPRSLDTGLPKSLGRGTMRSSRLLATWLRSMCRRSKRSNVTHCGDLASGSMRLTAEWPKKLPQFQLSRRPWSLTRWTRIRESMRKTSSWRLRISAGSSGTWRISVDRLGPWRLRSSSPRQALLQGLWSSACRRMTLRQVRCWWRSRWLSGTSCTLLARSSLMPLSLAAHGWVLIWAVCTAGRLSRHLAHGHVTMRVGNQHDGALVGTMAPSMQQRHRDCKPCHCVTDLLILGGFRNIEPPSCFSHHRSIVCFPSLAPES